jgi:hypothetical protein
MVKMDTSSQYIKMCKEANEVQELKRGSRSNRNIYFNLGDWYFIKGDTINLNNDLQLTIEKEKVILQEQDNYVWIPNMSQLSEFCNESINTLCAIVDHWRKDTKYLAYINDSSGEQLFLAFFMITKFQKMWKNDMWIQRDN